MMKFEIQHVFFAADTIVCDEKTFPKWMMHKDFKWFLDKHVLTLRPEESVETDFRKITRKE